MVRKRRGFFDRSDRNPDEESDFSHLLSSFKRTEIKRDGSWYVQGMSALQAVKVYSCPGCNSPIQLGVAHVVVWQAEGLFGDDQALADRRHWHNQCWKVRY